MNPTDWFSALWLSPTNLQPTPGIGKGEKKFPLSVHKSHSPIRHWVVLGKAMLDPTLYFGMLRSPWGDRLLLSPGEAPAAATGQLLPVPAILLGQVCVILAGGSGPGIYSTC